MQGEDYEGSSRGIQGNESLLAAALSETAIEERCIVAEYRTTEEQRSTLSSIAQSCGAYEGKELPIEWVIDIADEFNGWFYATAYGYNDADRTLHVMVPDRENPHFDGLVQLDHRAVHLLECVDGTSAALFNKIVRDSIVKVKWDVEWWEESSSNNLTESDPAAASIDMSPDENVDNHENAQDGVWVQSTARYFIRIANQLLVDDTVPDSQGNQGSKGLVIITADSKVRLLTCHKGRGQDDFCHLIAEGVVQASEEAQAQLYAVQQEMSAQQDDNRSSRRRDDDNDSRDGRRRGSPSKNYRSSNNGSGSGDMSITKLAKLGRDVKYRLYDLLEERDRKRESEREIATQVHAFTMSGDLDMGLQLLEHFAAIRSGRDPDEVSDGGDADLVENLSEDEGSGADNSIGLTGSAGVRARISGRRRGRRVARMDALLDEAVVTSSRLEKALHRAAKEGRELTPSPADDRRGYGSGSDDERRSSRRRGYY